MTLKKEMTLDKKQIWTIFLFKFKMGHKAVETTHNINSAFGLETADKCSVRWWFRKFCLGDESLEDEERSGQPLVVDSDQLRAIIEADPVTTTQEIPKSTASTILWSFGIWSELERWKSSVSTNQKTSFDVLSPLTLCHSNKPFLISLWRVMKSGFYKTTAVTSCGWTEGKLQSTPQSHTWFKKRSWSLFGGLLLLWVTSTFWILVKPLCLRRMLSKSMRCTKNCNTCRPHWSLEGVQFSSTTSACLAQPVLQKLNELMKFCFICHIHQTSCQLRTTSSISTTLWGENASTTSRRRKMLSKSLWNPKVQIFILQE